MQIREAAKGLITTEDRKLLFVAGKSGRLNLPGGGIEDMETSQQAFLREIKEETGLDPEHLFGLKWTFTVAGETTSSEGLKQFSSWIIFQASLAIPSSELYIPEGSEITRITSLSEQECLEHGFISHLAQKTVQIATGNLRLM